MTKLKLSVMLLSLAAIEQFHQATGLEIRDEADIVIFDDEHNPFTSSLLERIQSESPAARATELPTEYPSGSSTASPTITGIESQRPTFSSASQSYLDDPHTEIAMDETMVPANDSSVETATNMTKVASLSEPPFSRIPSTRPSFGPSSSPTLECHDRADYESPINGFACEDHANTDCLAWRFLGLNITQLVELVNSCPVTCDIDCGTFHQFAISVAFRISQVPGLLDIGVKMRLEEASLSYLEDFILDESNWPVSVMVKIETVELTYQNMIEKNDIVRRRHLIRNRMKTPSLPLQEVSMDPRQDRDAEALDVAVLFKGFTIGIESEMIELVLHEGIASPGYRIELRRSDDFFGTAEIHPQNGTVPLSPSAQTQDDLPDSSRATMVVSVLVPVVVVGFALGSLLYHRYSSGGWVTIIPKRMNQSGGSVSRSGELSPYRSRSQSEDKRVSDANAGRENSFGSDDETTIAGVGGSHHRSSLRRFIASLSLSRSRTSTEPDSNEENEMQNRIEPPATGGPIVSRMNYSADNDNVDDAFARAFPPMIVIDNIDDNDNLETNSSESDEKNDVDMASVSMYKDKGLDAFATEFREAIKTHNKNSQSLVFPDAFKNLVVGNESTTSERPDMGKRSSLDMLFGSDSEDGSEDEDDECSIASTPVRSENRMSKLTLRRTSSFNDVNRPILPVVEQVTENDQGVAEGAEPTANDSFVKVEKSMISPMSPSTPPEVLEKGRARGLPPIRPWHTPERWRRDRTKHQQGHSPKGNTPKKHHRKVPSLLSLGSPITKAIFESTGVGGKRPMLPRLGSSSSNSTSGHHRRTSSSSISGHHRRTSSSSISADGNHSNDEDRYRKDSSVLRLELVAPRRGQLGLVLEQKKASPVYVAAVKDYSPLFGMIQLGDRFLEIDNKNVSYASLGDVTNLLTNGGVGSMPMPFGSCNTNLKIVVLRKSITSAARDHKRHGSHGSAGSGGSVLGSTMID